MPIHTRLRNGQTKPRSGPFLVSHERLEDLATNSFTPATPLPVGSYVAWVQAFDSSNQTRGWSAPYHFVVTPPAK